MANDGATSMSDSVLETPEVFDASETPTPLASRADVRRFLAKVIRQIHKGTHLDYKVGQTVIMGLGVLAKIMTEDEESELLIRVEAIERARAQEAAVQ